MWCILVCGNWGILESDDAALVHRVWWGEGAMSALGLTACALLCDPWCGVLVSWWVVSGMPYPGVCSVVLLPAPWLSDASSWMVPVMLMSAMHGV